MKINISLILVSACFSVLLGAPLGIDTGGSLEGRIGLVTDTTRDGSNLVHMERLSWSLNSDHDRFDYGLDLGAVLRQSSEFESVTLTPEYNFKAQLNPVARLQFGLFSYSQLRNPMQILQDTLQYMEQVHGFQVKSPLPGNGSFSISTGLRKRDIETSSLDQQFMRLQLERAMLGMKFRLSGEQNAFSGGALAESEAIQNDRTHLTLQWYGSPVKNLNWMAVNSHFQSAGHTYWRVYQRANYQLGEKAAIWAHLNQGMLANRDTDLLRRSYGLTYRRTLGQYSSFDILSEGNRVTPEEGDPVQHWRAYRAGLNWHKHEQNRLGVILQSGFKESYLDGKGLDLIAETEVELNLRSSSRMRMKLIDEIESELFFRLDESEFLYDLNHHLRWSLSMLPAQRFQYGTDIGLINHFGVDLDFSEDTLRNAITNNIYLKLVEPRMRASVNHFTILDIGEESDLRLHLNTRFTYRLKPGVSLNLLSMYRYASDVYPEYLWLTGFLKVDMRMFEWALDIEAQGLPQDVFKQDMRIWMRFMRQI